MRRVIWNSWKRIGKLKFMKNQSFEVLFHKQIRNARRRSKEKSAMKHSWWQSCQPLLEHFVKSNLCMLYVVSKLRKLKIQCFKRCIIRSWNEGVQPLQSDHSKLKEEFCTALRNHPFVARWFRSLFVQCCVSPLKFPVTMEAEYHKMKDHFAALRN